MRCKHGFYKFHCAKIAEKYQLESAPCLFEDPRLCREYEEEE